MNRTSFGALVQRHRLAFSLCGIVAGSAVVIPACSGGPGEIFTTNAGSITIVEVVPANDPQDFNYTTVGIGLSSFSLDDDPGDATLSDTKAFTTLLTNVTYTVNVGATSGWALPVISCSSTGGAGSSYAYSPLGVAVTLAQGANVTCVFNDSKAKPGSITIVKDAQPNDAQDFAFTHSIAASPGFSLDDDADATLSNQRTFSNLGNGTYTFTETQLTGWTLAGIACTPSAIATGNVSTGTATIVLAAGEDVTCTFTNTAVATTPGSITIVKDAQPNDPQDFAFTHSIAASPGFSLDDDADPALSNQRVFANLTAGTYTFTETQVSGWILTSIVCTPSGGTGGNVSTGTATIALAAGANVTCTFTNARTGSITIVKDAQPNSAQDFAFTSGQASTPGFTLDDDSDPTLSNQRVFTNLGSASYTFTETAVTGWNLASIACTPSAGTSTNIATGVVTIGLAVGANVTCTFTNTVVPAATGTLTIIKDALPDDAQDFHFATVGAGLSAFDLDDDPTDGALPNSKTFTGLAAGVAFTVTEDAVAGWTVPSLQCLVAVPGLTTTFTDQLNRTFTVNLEAGANVTCTFTNVRTAPVTGSITIVKDAQPNSAQDFAFTHSIAASPGFSLDDDADPTLSNQRVFSNLAAGTYTFAETAVSGWNLTSVVCSPSAGTSTNVAGVLTVVLTAGANVVCTFTNVQATGTLTIIKDAQPDNAQDFHYTTVGAGLSAFDLDDDPSSGALANSKTFTGLAAGVAFTVTEDAVAGWTVPSLQCIVAVPGSTTTFTDQLNRTFTVNLEAGANVTCTFSNVFTPPATGSITIVKDAQPNSAQDFAFTHSIAASPGFSLDDDADATLSNQRVFSNLAAGTYTFAETAVSGWNLTSVVCSPSAGTSTNIAGVLTVVLTAGANVTCTFTNTQATGTLTIVKDAVPNDVQIFHFTTTGGAGLADFDLDDDGNNTNALPNSRTFILPAGAYSITEGAVAGWTLQNITCTQGGAANSNVTGSVPVINVTLGAGGTLTCTFNNTKP